MTQGVPLDGLTNDDLHFRLRRVLASERRSCVELLQLLAEVDRRRSYLGASAPSLFAFCTRELGMSEAETYLRIRASRAARRFPVILEFIAAGRLHLTAVARLSCHLTESNHRALLLAAGGRSQRDINRLVAGFAPEPPRRPRIELVVESADSSEAPPSTSLTIAFDFETSTGEGDCMHDVSDRNERVEVAPEQGLTGTSEAFLATNDGAGAIAVSPAPGAPGVTADGSMDPAPGAPSATVSGGIKSQDATGRTVTPGDPAASSFDPSPRRPPRYRLHVTISESAMTTLDILTDLMRHQVPDGDPALILERALENLLEVVSRRKFGLQKSKRAGLVRGLPASPMGPRQVARAEEPPSGSSASVDVVPIREPREVRETLEATGEPDTTRETRPGARSRHIPAAVRRAVRERDGSRCAFRAEDGRRCAATAWLEYHHVVPFARGGPATVENIEIRCRAHNQHEARRDFGARASREARAGTEAQAGREERTDQAARTGQEPCAGSDPRGNSEPRVGGKPKAGDNLRAGSQPRTRGEPRAR